MVALISIFDSCISSLTCKIMAKNKLNNQFFIIMLSIFPMFLSCENQTSGEAGSLIIAIGETKSHIPLENQSISNNSAIVFTGNDIQWFSPTTREIKFKKNVNIGSFQTYQKIHFKLNNEHLFTVQTYTSQYHSFIIKDLVLFIDLFTKKCYLHDCYPLNIAENDAETQANKEKRHDAWNSFLIQLKTENRIR